jgi:hypothetical protein
VFNIAGQKIVSQELNAVETVIEYRFISGVYLVKVGNETAKVVIR